MKKIRPTIAIIGAGFSGSLLTLHLLKVGPPDLSVSLVERGARFGRGVAYGTHNPRHLLNVRVANMSAWPDEPDHLARWLAEDPQAHGRQGFISRGDYGRYLGSMLQAALGKPDRTHQLLLEPDEATAIERVGGRFRLTMAMGRSFEVDAVVLATGYLPTAKARIPGLGDLELPLYAANPWAGSVSADLAEDDPVLLLGSGLTMVDVAVALDAAGHNGRVRVLSRRGLVPRRHEGAALLPARAPCSASDQPLSKRLAALRARAAEIGWREAMDELRPVTQSIWRRGDLMTRRRFLRHLRPWWDVHRHRLAPAVADWFDEQCASGRLTIDAGRIIDISPDGDRARVTWRPRGEARTRTEAVARIINCTGPGAGHQQAADPLVRSLLARGTARVDPLGLGLDVDDEGRVLDADGRPDERLYAVGPATRGAFWEVIAVPDIRNQVADLAIRLSRALG